jgi:predicted phosphodiesterase
MRIAVISDIHGNYEACQQVLEDIDKTQVDAVISLGDNIGYGPEPDRVIREIRARKIPSILGNHELAIKDEKYLKWFNPTARDSLF